METKTEQIICGQCDTPNPLTESYCKKCHFPLLRPDLESLALSYGPKDKASSERHASAEAPLGIVRTPTPTKGSSTQLPNAVAPNFDPIPEPNGQLTADPFLGLILGNFRLQKKLGEGGFGAVYLVEQIHLEQPFAIKILKLSKQADPEFTTRFRLEAKAIAKLRHENVVQLADFGQLPGNEGFYLVMEYLEGLNLNDCFNNNEDFSIPTILHIFQQLCSAIHHAHNLGIQHRDLKPGNIFLVRNALYYNKVKIIDFGLTTMEEEQNLLTQSGVCLGSPSYMSPEQARGDTRLTDGRSDLYSLGIILFRMLTGRLPFAKGKIATMVYNHVHVKAPSLKEVAPFRQWSPRLESFVASVLAKSPEDRPPNAGTFWKQLEKALADQTHYEPDEEEDWDLEETTRERLDQLVENPWNSSQTNVPAVSNSPAKEQPAPSQSQLPTPTPSKDSTPSLPGMQGAQKSSLAPPSKAFVEIIGSIIEERYEIKEPLAKGGMGSLYIAFDQEDAHLVALKLVPKSPEPKTQIELQKRMKREIKVLRLIEDERVVQLLDWGEDPRWGMFYTMELLEDALTLKHFLHTHQPSFIKRLRLIGDILFGLLALHEIKVIHRDIKSNNILCVGDPQHTKIKIIDPGIARWFPNELREQYTVKTEAGSMIGTPHYSAPEMWKEENLDARTDIYQAGILIYEILTGTLPFRGNLDRLIYQHLREAVPSVAKSDKNTGSVVPEQHALKMDAIIAKATAKEPEERYPSLHEFCDAILELLHETYPSASSLASAAISSGTKAQRGTTAPATTLPTGDIPGSPTPPIPIENPSFHAPTALPEKSPVSFVASPWFWSTIVLALLVVSALGFYLYKNQITSEPSSTQVNRLNPAKKKAAQPKASRHRQKARKKAPEKPQATPTKKLGNQTPRKRAANKKRRKPKRNKRFRKRELAKKIIKRKAKTRKATKKGGDKPPYDLDFNPLGASKKSKKRSIKKQPKTSLFDQDKDPI